MNRLISLPCKPQLKIAYMRKVCDGLTNNADVFDC